MHLKAPLAYTTVMTTLSRLCDNRLLRQRKIGKTSPYSESVSKVEKLLSDLGADTKIVLHSSEAIRQTPLDHLVDEFEQVDGTFLDELEHRIQERRRQVAVARSPGGS